jgi:hypothetical protein
MLSKVNAYAYTKTRMVFDPYDRLQFSNKEVYSCVSNRLERRGPKNGACYYKGQSEKLYGWLLVTFKDINLDWIEF